MKTLKFDFFEKEATRIQKFFGSMLFIALFGSVYGSALIAFFAPDLLTWSTPGSTYEYTAWMTMALGVVFVWQNRSALFGIVAASLLLVTVSSLVTILE